MSQHRLNRALRRLASTLGRFERQVAGDNDVSVSQLRLLSVLADSPATSQRMSDLARDQGLAVSTMTRNVALLERRGWVRRIAGTADKRTVVVGLTDEGQAQVVRLEDATEGMLTRAFGKFHASDTIERAVALDRVATALERALND